MKSLRWYANFLLLTMLIILLSGSVYGKSIPLNQAMVVAQNFMTIVMDASKDTISISSFFIKIQENDSIYYVFNINPAGWVIVSSHDAIFPIIAYSKDGHYAEHGHPPAFDAWIDATKKMIYTTIKNHQVATSEIINFWMKLTHDAVGLKKGQLLNDIDPLTKTKWAQGYPFNKKCPYDSDGDGYHALVGCAAVAMAQLMEYWSHPKEGEGHHGYFSDYGYEYACFEQGFYDWPYMAYSLDYASNYQIEQVSRLLYHCGVASEMDYGTEGSRSNIDKTAAALIDYFRYTASMHVEEKYEYSYSEWATMLRNELNNGRPVIYRGTNSDATGGHQFLCDGYAYIDGYCAFHFNWGWEGDYNGYYYYISDLTPGEHDFNYLQTALFGIKPVTRQDDTPKTATHLYIPHVDYYSIQSEDDLDWYKALFSKGEKLKIYTERIYDSTLDPQIHFYGPYEMSQNDYSMDVRAADFIDYDDDSHGNRQPELNLTIPETGTYFFRISGYKNKPKVNSSQMALENKQENANTGQYALHVDRFGNYSIFAKDFDIWGFPPLRWDTLCFNGKASWKLGNLKLSDGTDLSFRKIDATNRYSAICNWSNQKQNETLLSEKFSLGHGTGLLEFYALYNSTKLNNFKLCLLLTKDYCETWTELWHAENDGKTWDWRKVVVDLGQYKNLPHLRLAWQYFSSNGGGEAVAVDGISLSGSYHWVKVESAETENFQLPTEFILYQNFPNPFNSATIISYQSPKSQHVILKVYDIMGREVTKLLDERKEPGIYKLNFNASHLPAGVYIYCLTAGEFSDAKKLILIK